jgi:hypothetical protein
MTTDYAFQQSLGLPGINRDQTPFQTKNYVDGQHARWYNGEARKMGGQFLCNSGTTEICRGLYGSITGDQIVFESGVNAINLYSGKVSSLSFFLLNNNGQSLPPQDVTPSGYAADINNLWCFDGFSDRPEPNQYIKYVLSLIHI